MKSIVVAESANDLLIQLIHKVDESNMTSQSSTGANVSPVTNLGKMIIEVTDPFDCVVTLAERKNNILGILGEVLWVLSGRQELPEYLTKLIPNLLTFSDDGYSWRGAYSHRLFNGNNQLEHALTQLRLDINTRKSVAMIADPSKDSISGYMTEVGTLFTKDNICNLGLLFEVIDNKLNLTVLNRSNDIVWGLTNVNITEFCIIQMIMAKMIGVEVGSYFTFSNNVHIYHTIPSVKKLIDSILAGETHKSAVKSELVEELVIKAEIPKYSSWTEVQRIADRLVDKIEIGETSNEFHGDDLLTNIARAISEKVNNE